MCLYPMASIELKQQYIILREIVYVIIFLEQYIVVKIVIMLISQK